MVINSMSNRVWVAALLCAGTQAAAAAGMAGAQTAYFPPEWGHSHAVMVSWDTQPGRATLLDPVGRVVGRYVEDQGTRTVTYDAPRIFENYSYHYDSCGNQEPTTYTSTRIRFARSAGTPDTGSSKITEDAQHVVASGCDKGMVLWSQSVDDATDYAYSHLDMSKRQGQLDLTTGAKLAGMYEGAVYNGLSISSEPQDMVVLKSGRMMTFSDSGQSYSFTTDAQGWWVVTFPWGQRAYTRLQSDSQGGQNWLMADVVNGKKQWVQKALMTTVKSASTFGSVKAASRNWEGGYWVNTDFPYFTRLRPDGTGERVFVDLTVGDEVVAPLNSWTLQEGKVVQDIPTSLAAKRYRTWQSVNKVGEVRWVLEHEVYLDQAGNPMPYGIRKRVHPQIDRGLPPPRGGRLAIDPKAYGRVEGAQQTPPAKGLVLQRGR